MKNLIITIVFMALSSTLIACDECKKYNTDDLQIVKASVIHDTNINSTIWEINVKGNAGKTTPAPAGQLHGAPVLGYVFPTTLKPTDVGFNDTKGILALALTSHPDFDDTPLWDENNDSIYDNDGIIWHPHWVVLHKDDRVEGGLSVKQFKKTDTSVKLPPTNPGMPMYMDSPGFQVITNKTSIKVVIPDYRINNQTDFKFDAVSAYMQVNTEIKDKPMLGVYKVYNVLSTDLSLPYTVQSK
ncbi:hypothetical protein IWQ47_000572 [Aquimarina sp. EL_43]|uniref:hypothetical protein n=1 Tax=Aquimarina TaxID=290174 RepID=UPI00046E6900|nr:MULTISPECIES: hypothetical protein [Aquimarina]MBG6128736.1 hypothetical protein [Aquimarina sp. EL_35]MBG6149799.1 hypothetical protein [Aquimarina sp. EL_32]MBG6167514.1 hypothetical protein [Aquimarina sp. EL_43]